MTQANSDFHIDRIVRIALIAAVIWWSFVLLYPFLGILAWALILSVALYPAFNWLSRILGNRPTLAATFITLINLVLLVGAIVLLTNNLVEWVAFMIRKISAGDQVMPPPPAAIKELPVIGDYLYELWQTTSANLGEAIQSYSSYFVNAGKAALALIASNALHLLYFIISIILSGYMMTQGKNVKHKIHKFAERVALDRGAVLVNIMGATIHNVASGVIGIALLQTLCFGVLLLIAQAPGAGILSFIGFILCVTQLGLLLLIIPIILWLFFTKSLMFTIVLGTLLIFVTLIDNLLKPFVLSRGLSTPMVVIFVGVIGGILTYGLIGLFIGPVVLATLHNLVHHWLNNESKRSLV